LIDKDTNRISDKVYRCKNGVFDIIDEDIEGKRNKEQV